MKLFSRHYKRIWVLGIMAALLSLISYGIAKLSFLEDIESKTVDYRFRLAPRVQDADSSVVMIAIDDGSLSFASQELKQGWPFPREYYAVVSEYLTGQGARAVIFDMIFDDPDFDRIDVSAEDSDGHFAYVMAAGSKVILAQLLSHQETEVDELLTRHQLPYAVDHLPNLNVWKGTRSPLPEFSYAARGVGAINLLESKDSTIRTVPAVYNLKGKHYPSLALSAIMNGEKTFPQEKFKRIPLNQKGELYLNWYGPGGINQTFKYLPFQDVLKSAVAKLLGWDPVIGDGYFKDKYVIIGATSGGLMDLKTSPYTWGMPGMEVWATAISNIKNEDYIRFLPGIWHLLILFGISFLVLILVGRVSSSLSAFGVMLALLVLLFAAYYSFYAARFILPVSVPILNLLLSWLFILTLSYIMEGKHKRELRMMFNRYLHPDLVDRIVDNPDLVQMGGEEYQATVMFSDIYNFTGFSEKHTPTELVSYLNEYFSQFTNSILDYKGLLDKYTGDGLMAVFGVPIPNPDHAYWACKAALAHRDFSLEFKNRTDLNSAQFFHLNTRLGINSGPLVAGNIGSERRMEYTSIGDTVNLSARLEGVNKVFKTHIIISEATYIQVKDKMFCRELDFLKVKGKKEPTRIFELIAERDKVDASEYGWISDYERALAEYRAGNWDAALKGFQALAEEPLNDEASRTLIKRCEILKLNPPKDWEGIFTLDEK
ncbi:MAG: adenylate/guanylate cyclase domain-containing protein [Candidatus Cloacimonetes bacterium]|nr:adenylate/guanylate cyclase domain-containing protein [Candidatus Cloacimonadota bacterium]